MTLLALSLLMLHSCGTQQIAQKKQAYRYSAQATYEREQEALRTRYGRELQAAALQVCQAVAKHLSPNTGRDFDATTHLYDGIKENPQEGWIACATTLQWQAKTSMFGSENDCEVTGTLYYYPSQRRIDEDKAWFVPSKHNRHVGNLSGGSWSKLAKGLMVTIK